MCGKNTGQFSRYALSGKYKEYKEDPDKFRTETLSGQKYGDVGDVTAALGGS
jgi:hypothetical protein